jgi:hypothetical protein
MTMKDLLPQVPMVALAHGPDRIGQAHSQILYLPQVASPFLGRAVWLA